MYELKQTPRQIVNELDQYIIGQQAAKKSVAVALRNRYRRLQLDEKMQQDITPKNMLIMSNLLYLDVNYLILRNIKFNKK